MTEFVTVAEAADVPPGSGAVVQMGDKAIALFNVGGEFYAIDNTCLHRGGPVGEGDLEDAIVTCPWHGFQYDVTTGRNVLDPDVGLETYPVRVSEGRVEIAIG